jgi:ppGpp synthetase/RelA/SpoT-type nucleotidyltranferase
MAKKRKLNSKNPKYMDKVVEVKNTKKLIKDIKGVRIYAIFNE